MSNKNSDVEIIDLGLHPYADTFVKKSVTNIRTNISSCVI